MSEQVFKIESGVPIPAARSTGVVDPNSRAGRIRQLVGSDRGASAFFEGISVYTFANSVRATVGAGMRAVGLTARTVDGGIRAWKL